MNLNLIVILACDASTTTNQTNTLIASAPQNPLDSKAFRRYYANKIEVLEANDLSLQPSTSAPCINVLVQDVSMYGK